MRKLLCFLEEMNVEKSMKQGCQQALLDEEVVRKKAALASIFLRINTFALPGHRPSLHCMFIDNTTGHHILHYWPATGKYSLSRTRKIGLAKNLEDALAIAISNC